MSMLLSGAGSAFSLLGYAPSLWLDAEASPLSTDASNLVSQVDDIAGNGYHGTATTTARPTLTRSDNYENRLTYSEDLEEWTATDATADSATLATFTAQNGLISQAVSKFVIAGQGLVFRVKLRRVSGNTALHLYHTGCTVTSTSITINGTLTEYSVNLAASGTTVTVGVQDQNAEGHGQIEMTEMQLREYELETETGYLATTTLPQYRGLHGRQCFLFDGADNALSVAFTATQAFTVFVTCMQQNHTGTHYAFKGPGATDAALGYSGTDLFMSAGSTLSGADVPDTIEILVGVFNGASSALYSSKSSMGSGDAGANGLPTSLTIGASFYGRILSVLIFPVVFSDGDRQLLLNHFMPMIGTDPSLIPPERE